MKRKEKKKMLSMISLYLNYSFQKSTIIIFSISLILLVISLIFISNPSYDKERYLLDSEAFHNLYFTEGIFVLEIFNGILVTTLVILLFLQSNSFDSLFLANTKRSTLVLSKVIASILFFLLLSLFEFVLLYGIPLFLYPDYALKIENLLSILYFFSSMTFLFSISIVLTILIPNIFSSMSILFLSIVKNMVATSNTFFKDFLKEIVPILIMNDGVIEMASIYIVPIFSALFIFIYYSIYNIKDIRI